MGLDLGKLLTPIIGPLEDGALKKIADNKPAILAAAHAQDATIAGELESLVEGLVPAGQLRDEVTAVLKANEPAIISKLDSSEDALFDVLLARAKVLLGRPA